MSHLETLKFARQFLSGETLNAVNFAINLIEKVDETKLTDVIFNQICEDGCAKSGNISESVVHYLLGKEEK